MFDSIRMLSRSFVDAGRPFLQEPQEQRTRLRHRLIAMVGLVALVGVDSAVRITRETAVAAASHSASRQDTVVSVDGGHPLFLESPPSEAGSTPPAAAGSSLPVFGIPATAFSAYLRAADSLAGSAAGCALTWPVLAGIGRVESDHARNGDVTPSGEVLHPIYGPALNGNNGMALIKSPDGTWTRAVGPMQFLPSTWTRWGADGNGDGRADPQNIFDATLTAGRYLCAGSGDLSTSTGLHAALLRYNPSEQYADTVLRWVRAYEHGGGPVPDQPNSTPAVSDDPEVSSSDIPARRGARTADQPPGRPSDPKAAPPSSDAKPSPAAAPPSGAAPSQDPCAQGDTGCMVNNLLIGN
jgi:hypothetical protein